MNNANHEVQAGVVHGLEVLPQPEERVRGFLNLVLLALFSSIASAPYGLLTVCGAPVPTTVPAFTNAPTIGVPTPTVKL